MQKAKRAMVWSGVYKAHVQSTTEASTEDMVEQMKDRERLTLERFQMEVSVCMPVYDSHPKKAHAHSNIAYWFWKDL